VAKRTSSPVNLLLEDGTAPLTLNRIFSYRSSSRVNTSPDDDQLKPGERLST
jgi:hypothetical protein